MKIEPSVRPCIPGDFGAKVSGNHLLLAQEVAQRLAGISINTAEDLIVYTHSFPSTVASQLGWSLGELDQAAKLLVVVLEGHVDPRFLHPSPAVDYGFGALNPRSTRR